MHTRPAIPLAELLAVQVRVILTLVLRETRATFGTSQIGYLWAILTPALSTGILVFLFSLIDRQPPFGPSLALFFATGILTIEVFNKLSTTLMRSFEANRALLSYPVIRATDTLFARTILIAATYAVIAVIFYVALLALDLADLPADPATLLLAAAAVLALGFGVGSLNAVLISVWASWEHIEKILTRPLIFVSGVFYVPSRLPREAQEIIWWNPVLHLVEWVREGVYPTYESALLTPAYPLLVALALAVLGLGGERILRKARARSGG